METEWEQLWYSRAVGKTLLFPGLASHCEWDRLVSGLSCADKEQERYPHPRWVVFSKHLLSGILASLANGIKCFLTPAIC